MRSNATALVHSSQCQQCFKKNISGNYSVNTLPEFCVTRSKHVTLTLPLSFCVHSLKQLAAAAEAAQSPVAVTSSEPPTAPVLLVLDTNCLLQFLPQSKRIAEDVLHYRADTSLLVPREVYRELDRKKVSVHACNTHSTTGYSIVRLLWLQCMVCLHR
jgi:hypothetical protein